jgi:hypothetical protein
MPSALAVLATFRPADMAATKVDLTGLMTELALHRWCMEIPLNPLGLQAIEAYLKAARLIKVNQCETGTGVDVAGHLKHRNSNRYLLTG